MDRVSKKREQDQAFALAVAELEKIIADPKFLRLRASSAQELTDADHQMLNRANELAERVSSLRREKTFASAKG